MFAFLREAAKRAVLTSMHAREMRGAKLSQSPALWDLTTSASGRLVWDGVELVELASRFGTPLQVVSRARLESDYKRFRDAFASRYPKVDIAYSYKTNPLPGVIDVLHRCGATAEVISEFELWLALELGMPGRRIIFNGPAKTRDALDLAIQNGIKIINIDGFTELEMLEEVAARSQRRQKVGLRVVTSVGWSGQFGMSIADGTAMSAFRRLKESAFLVPCGLHVHLGNGLRNTGIYVSATREALAFLRVVRAELGIEVEHLDLGGGFGVPTVRPFSTFDLRYSANGFPVRAPQPGEAPSIEDYATAITDLLRSEISVPPERLPELILEPGRAITSSAQLLLLKVLAIKQGSAGDSKVILDGGKNIAMPPGWEYHEAFLTDSSADRPLRRYSVYGPLCHTGDVMFIARQFPELQVGDVIAVMDSGAYFIPNQMNFSNPRTAAVILEGGRAATIRARESFNDLVRLDHAQHSVDEVPERYQPVAVR
jgi:diaminopimelate decarboxylase